MKNHKKINLGLFAGFAFSIANLSGCEIDDINNIEAIKQGRASIVNEDGRNLVRNDKIFLNEFQAADISEIEKVIVIDNKEGDDGLYKIVIKLRDDDTLYSGLVDENSKKELSRLSELDKRGEDGYCINNEAILVNSEGIQVYKDEKGKRKSDNLADGTYVVMIKSSGSKLTKIMYCDDDKWKIGYVDNKDVFNIENPNVRKEFAVQNTADVGGLKVRSESNRWHDPLKILLDGQKVFVIDPQNRISYDKCQWVRIIYKDGNSYKIGWVAYSQDLNTSEQCKYLRATHNELGQKIDENGQVIVDQKYVNPINPNDPLDQTVENSNIINSNESQEEIVESGYMENDSEENLYDEDQVKLDVSRNVQIHNDGNNDVVFGIDIDPQNIDLAEFENLLASEQEVATNDSNGTEIKGKVNFVYIKMGASSYGRFKMSILEPERRVELAEKCAQICEKYKVPYSFYFYDQAVNLDETLREVNYLNLNLPKLTSGKYCALKVMLDEEFSYQYKDNYGYERIAQYALNGYENFDRLDGLEEEAQKDAGLSVDQRRENLMYLKRLLKDSIKDASKNGVGFYTNVGGLKNIICEEDLTPEERESLWVVDFLDSNDYSQFDSFNNEYIRQVVHGNEHNGLWYDVDIIDVEILKRELERCGISYIENDRNVYQEVVNDGMNEIEY